MRTTGAGQSPLLLLDVIDILDSRHIPYAVIGAMAASFHGIVRGSADADALLSLSVSSLASLEDVFKKMGLVSKLRRGSFDDPIAAGLSLHDTFMNRVDLLVGIRHMDSQAFTRAKKTRFEKADIRVISLEDFIAMKIYAGGPKDLDDARQAIAVSGKSLDRSLVEKLAKRFGRQEFQMLRSMLSKEV